MKNLPRLNLDKLKTRCLSEVADFSPGMTWTQQTPTGPLMYKDNGGSILAVAHLDTVQGAKFFNYGRSKDGLFIENLQLDDRLGAYIILDYLPSLGMKYDILLTTGEETGQSTAKHFKTEKEYKWMFSFDREKVSTVLYQFDSPELRAVLEPYGFIIEYGSFSDIRYLDHLKCAGINFGCGYQDYHGPDSHFFPTDTLWQLKKFQKLWRDWEHKRLPLKDGYDKTWSYSRAVSVYTPPTAAKPWYQNLGYNYGGYGGMYGRGLTKKDDGENTPVQLTPAKNYECDLCDRGVRAKVYMVDGDLVYMCKECASVIMDDGGHSDVRLATDNEAKSFKREKPPIEAECQVCHTSDMTVIPWADATVDDGSFILLCDTCADESLLEIVPLIDSEEDLEVCDYCGADKSSDEMAFVTVKVDGIPEDMWACRSCREYLEKAGDLAEPKTHQHKIEKVTKPEFIKGSFVCDKCRVRTNMLHTVRNLGSICDSCYSLIIESNLQPEEFGVCSNCSSFLPKDVMTYDYHLDEYICDSCMEAMTDPITDKPVCSICHDPIEGAVFSRNREDMCLDCYNKAANISIPVHQMTDAEWNQAGWMM